MSETLLVGETVELRFESEKFELTGISLDSESSIAMVHNVSACELVLERSDGERVTIVAGVMYALPMKRGLSWKRL